MKVYKRLGFTHMETAELVTTLNKLLSNYQVHYQKLRKFHWNVEGQDFFELHEVFEEEYNSVKENIDDVAERIRVFGKFPIATMAGYLNVSEIVEVEKDMTSMEMVKEILNDFEILLTSMVEVIDAAKKIGDSGTYDLISGFIKRIEQRHWMLTAWSKETKVSALAN
ncbi:MAG: DNA starvation/stationary phase protection protein [Chitinophagales bacterium]